jgi:hypothetical protein
MRDPRRLTTRWASKSCYRDSFALPYLSMAKLTTGSLFIIWQQVLFTCAAKLKDLRQWCSACQIISASSIKLSSTLPRIFPQNLIRFISLYNFVILYLMDPVSTSHIMVTKIMLLKRSHYWFQLQDIHIKLIFSRRRMITQWCFGIWDLVVR